MDREVAVWIERLLAWIERLAAWIGGVLEGLEVGAWIGLEVAAQ